MTKTIQSRTKALSLLVAALVAFSATVGFAGLAGAATTTDLTVSITDDDNTLAPGETTTVEVAVANADGGVGAAELGIELSDPGVAEITDVSILHSPGNAENNVAGGGQSADVKYAFADSPDTGSVTIVEVTLQAAAAGSTEVNVVPNSQTGNLVVFDEVGGGYTLNTVGSATLTVEEPTQPAPADFQVSNLQAPSSATQGDAIDVSADVQNTGEETATKAVEFRVDADGDGSIDDESAVLSQDVELDPGESTTVGFEDVDTSGLPVGTLTHGVATPDDSATAQITIEEPAAPPTSDVTVSLQPADQQTAIGATTTYDVVASNVDGGVGAGEVAVTIDDTSIATITDVEVLNDASVDALITDSSAEFDYFGADTDDTGSVTIATVTVAGAGEGTASLSLGPADGNSDVLLFDEAGNGYDVTGTSGATVEVLPVQFSVESVDAPEKAAVGSTVEVTATVSSDGSVESTQPVELLFDVDGDGNLESVGTEQVTVSPNGQTQVTFTVDVPADASLGDRGYSVETLSESAAGTMEFTPPALSPDQDLPADPNGDGVYEDVNGDGSVDVGDAQSLFSNRETDAVQNNVAAFDFNGDGMVNVGDAQALFNQVTG
jgi:hypothetical protein